MNKINEHLEVVKKFNRSITRDYEVLNTFDSREAFNTFYEEAAALIEEAESMTGAHITEEGIKNKIRNDIEELAARKIQEADDTTATYRERKAATMEKLEQAIHSRSDTTGQNAAQIALCSSELEGEVKGTLYSLKTPHSVVMEFESLAQKAQYDKSIARFLSKNYYLFLDHVKAMDVSENEKNRTFYSISTNVERLKTAGYSEKELALFAVRGTLKLNEFSTTGAKMNIQQNARVLLNKYK